MARNVRFRLNSPQVVSETVDGEAIVVNLDSGTYFSIKGDGVLVWNAILNGATVEELTAAVSAQAGADTGQVEASMAAFCESLAAEGLIAARTDAADAPVLDFASAGAGLLEPAFESYNDMQDLILLDPVHEVAEQGWPHVQAGA
jgi:hypothetical protein